MQCRQPLWTICLHGNGKIMEFNTEGARCSSQDCLRGRSIITETAGLIIIHFLERWDKGECDQVLQRDCGCSCLRQQTNDLDLQNKWFTTRLRIFVSFIIWKIKIHRDWIFTRHQEQYGHLHTDVQSMLQSYPGETAPVINILGLKVLHQDAGEMGSVQNILLPSFPLPLLVQV